MALNIMEKLRARGRQKLEPSEAKYQKLVRQAATTGKVDVGDLGDAAESLKLTAEDVDGHVEAVRRHIELQQAVEPYRGKEAELERLQCIEPQLAELERQRLALIAQRANAAAALESHVANKCELKKIERQNPILWPSATPAPMPPAKPRPSQVWDGSTKPIRN